MSVAYRAVLWNRQKRIYDISIACGVLAYLALFIGIGSSIRPQATAETLIIRAGGTLGLLLLHVILSIGPLCRLSDRFLPLLYNRRHLGVTMFLVASLHAGFVVFQFHALGDVNPWISLLTSNTDVGSLGQFPFELLGLAAWSVLLMMAVTSHDFWLHNLSAPVWKSLHMLVYLAYGLLILHVVLGVLQDETSPALTLLLAIGFVWIISLHLAAALRERRRDEPPDTTAVDGFLPVCRVDEIPQNRARIVCVTGERVAIFRHDGKISAVSNVCKHQNGPLGEGRIIDGCITCPWHGYQYVPETGASPPPFNEKVPTFNVRVVRGQVLLDRRPNPPGTRVEPARTDAGARHG